MRASRNLLFYGADLHIRDEVSKLIVALHSKDLHVITLSSG